MQEWMILCFFLHRVLDRDHIPGHIAQQHVLLKANIPIHEIKVISFLDVRLEGRKYVFEFAQPRQRPLAVPIIPCMCTSVR